MGERERERVGERTHKCSVVIYNEKLGGGGIVR